MQVYFDTEFSDTEKRNGHRYLISIGCVAENGREFYAELTDTWDESLCSLFTIETVLPLLDGGECRMEVKALAAHLKAWIEGLTDAQITFRSDAPHYDWPFVQEIFDHHSWPKNLQRECLPVCAFESDTERFRYNNAVADFWRTSKAVGATPHHALWDVRSIRFAHRYSLRKRF